MFVPSNVSPSIEIMEFPRRSMLFKLLRCANVRLSIVEILLFDRFIVVNLSLPSKSFAFIRLRLLFDRWMAVMFGVLSKKYGGMSDIELNDALNNSKNWKSNPNAFKLRYFDREMSISHKYVNFWIVALSSV